MEEKVMIIYENDEGYFLKNVEKLPALIPFC